MAQNRVIAGDNMGAPIMDYNGMGVSIGGFNYPIKEYELVTEEVRKSAASGIGRGLVGNFFLGPVGALVGIASAKSKGTYTVAIQYGDGLRSLVEVDDKIYKTIVKSSF